MIHHICASGSGFAEISAILRPRPHCCKQRICTKAWLPPAGRGDCAGGKDIASRSRAFPTQASQTSLRRYQPRPQRTKATTYTTTKCVRQRMRCRNYKRGDRYMSMPAMQRRPAQSAAQHRRYATTQHLVSNTTRTSQRTSAPKPEQPQGPKPALHKRAAFPHTAGDRPTIWHKAYWPNRRDDKHNIPLELEPKWLGNARKSMSDDGAWCKTCQAMALTTIQPWTLTHNAAHSGAKIVSHPLAETPPLMHRGAVVM